jgi:ABC-2 type transport system ATP-binding protein
MIAGCLPPDEGTVIINGADLRKDPLKAKAMMGFLPEDNPLYDEMYVTEYLEYVAGLYALKDCRESVKEVIRQTGLQEEMHKTIGQLSKGYRQRVGLAQAILHHPELVVLDEPTTGLDPNQTVEINTLLLSLSQNKGILFSSHTLSEAATICTRILFIHRGKIVADLLRKDIGNLESLFKELTT